MLGLSTRLVLTLVNILITSMNMTVYIIGYTHACDVSYQFITLILI